MTTAWARLPNAEHIDRVLAHLKAHPDRWSAAWDAAWDAARGAAWGAARGAILALVAWDDCAYILDLPSGAVRLMCAVNNHKAILLYPAVLAMSEEGVTS